MKNIIFLDIDGVINSRRTLISGGNFPHDFSNMELFDNTAIKMIQKLCEKTNSKIVISST